MMRIQRGGERWSLASRLFILALTISRVAALSQQYCADFNTGSGKQTSSSTWMTNGKCHDQCNGYAFGVVQGQNCWCTNIAPGDTTSTGDCGVKCPGYPSEQCGDESKGLFGYVALGPAPQGTQGGSSSASSASSTPSPSPSPSTSQTEQSTTVQQTTSQSQVTVQDTVTPTPSISTVSVTPSTTPSTSTSTTSKYVPVPVTLSTSSSTPTTSSSSTSTSSSSSSSTWTATPFMSVMTVTGQVKTMTITPTAPPASTQTVVNVKQEADKGFFSNPGKVAGTFVAVALALAAIIAGIIFLLWRKKRRQQQEILPSTAGSGTPQRRPSRMSQMGLIAAGGAGSQKERAAPPTITTTGWGPGNSAERSPADTLEKRSSYPRVVDQRLEPTAVWNPLHDNGSHVSIRSFRDDQDYSRRMLRVANPDD